MVLNYVLKNFSRRKVRTALMVLSLLISTALIVTMSATVATMRQSNVDFVISDVGATDVTIAKKDTSFDMTIPIAETTATVLSADNRITNIHPRINLEVDYTMNGRPLGGTLIGLDSKNDTIGTVIVKEGEYAPGNNQIAVFEEMAIESGLNVGDTLTISYAIPRPRAVGEASSSGASQRRIQEQFTINSIIVSNGVAGTWDGMIVELSDLQTWLNIPGQAMQLLITVDDAIYEGSNADVSALEVREIGRNIQSQLSSDYWLDLEKAIVLSASRQDFQAAQALINIYGLISLAVVGLLVYTLVLTNVQEQRRDMAVLRILGSPRKLLFQIVIIEVIVIGMVGVGLGVLLGKLLTTYVAIPLMVNQIAAEGGAVTLSPEVSLSAILPAVVSAFIVLIISGIRPAADASRTKVMHAINPGVADNVQLEDLTQLRVRKPNIKLFLIGTAMMAFFSLLFGSNAIQLYGGARGEVVILLTGLLLLVSGVSMMFFITTIPFEKLILALMRLIAPRLTYFAQRNVSRGQTRNTLIAMLVMVSGVLPSFLATQMGMVNANFESDMRDRIGAPIRLDTFSALNRLGQSDFYSVESTGRPDARLEPDYVQNQVTTIAGVDKTASLTYPFSSAASDAVVLRSASIEVFGVMGNLAQTAFPEMMTFAAGDVGALQTILDDPETVIISEGLARYLAVELGETIELTGAGYDNLDKLRVVGILRSMPGIDGIGRGSAAAKNNSTVLVGMTRFGQLITPPNDPLPLANDPLLETVYVTIDPDADIDAIADSLFQRFDDSQPVSSRFLELEVEANRSAQVPQQTFLLALTAISFTTAVFGVFAIIYVTIFARRIEIGMLKAMGMLRKELTRMLILESIAMTLGSALAGIAAGATMGYASYYGQNALRQLPINFAIDTIVMPAIVVLVVMASMLGATFSSRRIVRKQTVEILRM